MLVSFPVPFPEPRWLLTFFHDPFISMCDPISLMWFPLEILFWSQRQKKSAVPWSCYRASTGTHLSKAAVNAVFESYSNYSISVRTGTYPAHILCTVKRVRQNNRRSDPFGKNCEAIARMNRPMMLQHHISIFRLLTATEPAGIQYIHEISEEQMIARARACRLPLKVSYPQIAETREM